MKIDGCKVVDKFSSFLFLVVVLFNLIDLVVVLEN